MATLWVMVSSVKAPSENVNHRTTHTSSKSFHHRNVRAHVNKRTQNVDHNQAHTKRRRRRKKDSDRNSYYYDNHNFDNHIINDKDDDNHIIKSNSYDEWLALVSRANKARENSNYTSTNSDKQNVTLWIFRVRNEMENHTTKGDYIDNNNDDIDQEVSIHSYFYRTMKYFTPYRI